MIMVINYGMGNIRSVEKAFQRLKVPIGISSVPAELMKASKLILPGVGHFANGVSKLKSTGIWSMLIEKVISQRTPILGICLGMQLMTNHSEEGDVNGFGWIDATTKRFELNKTKLKIPHMGWNTVEVKKQQILSTEISPASFFYYVHSYYVSCADISDVLFETNYGVNFVSGFQKDNIYGVQFHPEKSHGFGLQLLKNFASL